jgi:Sec-independent protein translocase protein TatA
MKKEKMPPRRRGRGIPVAAAELQQEVRELRERMEDMETSMKREPDTGDVSESEEETTSEEEEEEEENKRKVDQGGHKGWCQTKGRGTNI